MVFKDEDVGEHIEKVKEYNGKFLKNTKKDLNIFFMKIQEYPLISLFFILAVILLFVFPYLQVHFHEIGNVTKEAELENQYRATLAQILGGIAIAIGLYYTWRRIGIAEKDLQATQKNLEIAQDSLKVTQKNLEATQKVAQDNLKVAREGQITERFTRAIDQLGNDKIEIRLGGIYALERISKESEDDYWPIMEILTAYIRKNSSFEVAANKKAMRLAMDIQANESTTGEATKVGKVFLDIQAILTVIERRKKSFNNGESNRLNLQGTCLEGANLEGAHLQGVDLRKAHLEGINLGGAYLEGADLREAHFEGTDLREAHLERADLKGAHLERADLKEAHLEGAYLWEAHLERADLSKAHLKVSELRGAHFEGANLYKAHLEGAYLWEAHLEEAVLLMGYLERADLRGAHLEGTDLRGAHLEGADLGEAHLERANLSKAHLEGANLSNAHLEGAIYLTIDQLSKVKTLFSAEIDEEFLIPLKEQYPALFEEPTSAEIGEEVLRTLLKEKFPALFEEPTI